MARGLNKVLLIGNLGADPEIRFTASGQPIAHFRLATSHYRRDPNGERQEITEWHRIVAFDRLAELASEFLHKGRQVYVEGRLQTRQWTDQQGQNRYTTEIIANEITLLGGGGQREEAEGEDWEVTAPAQLPKPQEKRPPQDEDLDDVPF
jgi:single-strand DNA-binding protein